MRYQPRLREELIRKLSVRAKRKRAKMTHILNDIVKTALADEPIPPQDQPVRKAKNGKGREGVA